MSPARRRQAVAKAMAAFQISERRACRALGVPVEPAVPGPNENERRSCCCGSGPWPGRTPAMATVGSRPCCGGRDGRSTSSGSIGSGVGRASRCRRSRGNTAGWDGARTDASAARPSSPDHVWSYDFIRDQTADGRGLNMLPVVHEFTRECLTIEVERYLKAEDVVSTLEYLRASGHFYDDLANLAACARRLSWYTVHRVLNETRWTEVGDGEHPEQAGRDRRILPDAGGPALPINRRHPLPSVLVIAVLAVLAGAAGPTAIARWAGHKEDLLDGHPRPAPRRPRQGRLPPRPDGAQARRLPGLLQRLDRSLRDEAAAETGVERPVIAIDGKTARRSHDASNGPRRPARGHRLGRRIRPVAGPGGLRREVQRDHGDPRAAEDGGLRGGDRHDRRDGGPEGDRRGGRPRQGRLRPGAEGEPRDAASGGRRVHRRAARGGRRRRRRS